MEINIYWGDLSEEGQETLRNVGFEPSEAQLKDNEPIGLLDTTQVDRS